MQIYEIARSFVVYAVGRYFIILIHSFHSKPKPKGSIIRLIISNPSAEKEDGYFNVPLKEYISPKARGSDETLHMEGERYL
jgi:hypothetical protein